MSAELSIANVCAGFGISEAVQQFEHTPGTRVGFGPGSLNSLGEWAEPLGKRALVVTDPGIVEAGYLDRAKETLEASGLAVAVFDRVAENPTTEDVAAGVAAATSHRADLIIGLGGGSSMDAAKGTNFILTNGGAMRDYWGKGKAEKPILPLIAVPTTAGTGSECQSFALISDAETHQKMACGDRKAAARLAILDPELTLTQPSAVTAHTGIDAVSHAVESHVTRDHTPVSRSYSAASLRLLLSGLADVQKEPLDLMGRARLQVGAAMAGTAIENSMLGAAHSAANPLTAHFDIIHGQAVGVMLPAVIRVNSKGDTDVRAAYEQLYPDGDLGDAVAGLLDGFGLKVRLRDLGVDED
ncbi:MAG: iron-containing alcohol dehydrogenase [Verrucomicrobiota bacterium]